MTRTLRGAAATLLMLSACAHRNPGPGAPLPAAKVAISVGPEAMALGEGGLSAWIVYGVARTKIFEERAGRFHNQSGDDYALELGARAALADSWSEQQGKVARPDPYLDLLVDVRRAGYLEEYVVGFFAKPGWTIPGEALGEIDLAAFRRWGSTRLEGHQPPTLVAVEPVGGAMWPTPPGEGLPNPSDLSPKTLPCGQSVPRLNAAVDAWSKEAAKLDGAPLAAASREEFARQVEWARTQPEYRGRGVTWVSPVPAVLYHLLGFCAVERHDLAEATRTLGESIRLDPLSPAARGELAHVLVSQKKFDDADRQIDGMLAISSHRCDLGVAWRKRGYILVERGRLEEAYAAYQKSLEHDPASRLAVDELVFIAREIQRLGGSNARALKPYQPPAVAPRQTVTDCRAE